MTTKAQEIVIGEVSARLNSIAFHYEERDRIRAELPNFSVQDHSDANSELPRLWKRIENEELSTLYELSHLAENVRKYFDVFGKDKNEWSRASRTSANDVLRRNARKPQV